MTLRSEWASVFSAAVGARVTVEEHDGEFDEAELRRVGASAPAILVTRLAFVDDGGIPGEAGIVGRYSAFVVSSRAAAKREGATSAGDLAELLAETVWAALLEHRVPSAQSRPSRMRGSNMFTSSTVAKGFTIWSVTWDQTELIRADLAAELSDLLELHTDFDIPPAASDGPPAPDTSTTVTFTPDP